MQYYYSSSRTIGSNNEKFDLRLWNRFDQNHELLAGFREASFRENLSKTSIELKVKLILLFELIHLSPGPQHYRVFNVIETKQNNYSQRFNKNFRVFLNMYVFRNTFEIWPLGYNCHNIWTKTSNTSGPLSNDHMSIKATCWRCLQTLWLYSVCFKVLISFSCNKINFNP